jgi:hypothetical protein
MHTKAARLYGNASGHFFALGYQEANTKESGAI